MFGFCQYFGHRLAVAGANSLRDNPEARAGISAITTLGRVDRPAGIADVVAFLASDDARWITGTIIDAGGSTFLSPAAGQ